MKKDKLQSRFNEDFLITSTEMLRAVAHPIRITIIDLLHRKEQLTVSEIHGSLNIEQAVASHHLRILKDKRVLASKREGKNTFYMLRSEAFYKVIEALEVI